ncbi:MAG: hypothetical protein A2091_04435 [Desulfuromonadales bacterium GWD2_61_12]|nr:MAG: hypothetical protein A2005_07510 [Desulfuromonadales bacterium GWC2_61_20]OGR34496.1 MAG: hypothetical protein A2091_04435 [Desulfuromonadales bacterium GWD2_61_12]
MSRESAVAEKHDIARSTLSVLCIVLLLVATLWVLRPFLPSLIWATMIVVATWSLMLRLEKWFWGKRSWAVFAMTIFMLLLLIVPVFAAVYTVMTNSARLSEWVKRLGGAGFPTPPEWLQSLPLVGAPMSEAWRQFAGGGFDAIVQRFTPYAGDATNWALTKAGGIGLIFVQLLLTVVIAAILFSKGEFAAFWLQRFASRLTSPERGVFLVRLAGQSVRAVFLGIVVTALVQAALSGFALWVTGVPFAALLAALALLLTIVQIGPFPVLLGATVWLYWSGAHVPASVLLVCTAFIGSIDNVIRPIMIRRGVDLPMLLILSGVIGGLVAFGMIGLFVGPVLLAVTYTLVNAWIDDASTENIPPPGMAVEREFPT